MTSSMPPIFRTLQSSTSAVLNARALYFGFYLSIGAFIPYINLYYERIGYTGVQIGFLAALPLLVSAITALIWGGIADAIHRHQAMLRLALILSPLAVYLISLGTSFITLLIFVIIYAVVSSPILPLLDSSALEVAREHHHSFGSLRVWGTVGWSVSTIVVGMLIERLDITWFFYSYMIFMAFTFLCSLFQPARRIVLQSSLGHGLTKLITNKTLLFFLFSVFLLSITSGAVNSFFSIYLDGIGTSEQRIGLAWALASLSEIPVMLFSGAIIAWIGSRGLLFIAFITYAVRWLLFSIISNPVAAMGVQLLHGLSFAAFLVGGVTYINERTPEGLSTTAQALFNSVTFGLGAIVGALLGGYLYENFGMSVLFQSLALLAVTALIVFWFASRTVKDISLSPSES